jgi:hypothetical protein
MAKIQKYIRCRMRDHTVWDIPALFIAENRANHYANHDTGKTKGKEFDKAFIDEVKYALNDNDELLDWAINNLNWEDVQDIAEFQEQDAGWEDPDYTGDWINGNKEIITR